MTPQVLGAYLEIPQNGGKIIIPPNQPSFHVGKKEIELNATKPLRDPNGYSAISSVRRDNSGVAISEHFIILNKNGTYFIQDTHSSNGTYLGAADVKKSGPLQLNEGDEIVLPIQEHGKLVQLKIFFRLARDPHELVDPNQPVYQNPQYQAPQGQTPSYNAPQYQAQAQPVYNAPPTKSSSMGTTSSGVGSMAIPQAQYNDPSQDADYDDPRDADDDESTNSFIAVHNTMTIPPNAFSPNSGVDLSMVYRLEKSEFWHIMVAFGLLFTMVYHTYINVMLIIALVSYLSGTVMPSIMQIFVEPIPIAIIFGLSFIVHEMSHLQTGKHFGFQSRFCLTNVGIKSTIKAAAIGIPFGLPGAAVSIGVDLQRDVDKMGYIKFAGPLSNFILGLVFVIGSFFVPIELFILKMGLIQGGTLNFVLGAFNLIPKEVKGFALDGKYIISWRRQLYIALLISFLIGYLIAYTLINSYQTQYYEWLYA